MDTIVAGLPWFAVRTIFRHGVMGDTAVFEEKITLYRAADADDAIDRAIQDAAKYVQMNPDFVQVQRYGVYALGHGQEDLDASEVWSYLSQGRSDPDRFFQDKYEGFALKDEQ